MNKELEWEEGLIDSSNLKSDRAAMLAIKKIIDERVERKKAVERLQVQVYQVYLEMEDYVASTEITQSNELLSVGYFLQKMLDIYQVDSNTFVEHFGLKNIEDILSGQKKIDVKFAQQIGNIFTMQSAIWIKVEYKNELWRVQNEVIDHTEKASITDISPALAA